MLPARAPRAPRRAGTVARIDPTRLGRLAPCFVLVLTAMVFVPVAPSAAAPAFHGSLGGIPLAAPIVAASATPSGNGYLLAARDGGVFAFGDARFVGSMGGRPLAAPVVDLARAPGDDSYLLIARDGGVFAFGGARFAGSMGGRALAAPIVAGVATPTGRGYLLLGADGGVFAFGDARFRGSLGGVPHGSIATDVAMRPQGDGYWILLADGRVFGFGGARHQGQPSAHRPETPLIAIDTAPDGAGYVALSAGGAVYAFGTARFFGAATTARLAPMVDLVLRPQHDGVWLVSTDGGVFTLPGRVPLTGTPRLSVTTVVSGLTVPWDVGFLPDATMLFTERPGRISALVGGAVRVLARPGDVVAGGEGGMLGLAIDPQFAFNRHVYTCFNTAVDVRVVKWRVNASVTGLSRVSDLVTGIPRSATGRHSGCRPRFGPDGHLWVGTGDAATGTNPQGAGSLGGKVLRVDEVSGAAAPENPFGLRWYTRGHRNVQGLAFRPGVGTPVSVEHGPTRDDEINVLVAGGNYGWDPVPGYDESVPMTDVVKFPGARRAIWSSGFPTIATSGATFLEGDRWRDWDGALAVANLKGAHLRVLSLDASNGVTGEAVALTTFGRLRTPVLGPDGSLYVTTSNGGGTDRILRVTPS